jgi:hypothetical protein
MTVSLHRMTVSLRRMTVSHLYRMTVSLHRMTASLHRTTVSLRRMTVSHLYRMTVSLHRMTASLHRTTVSLRRMTVSHLYRMPVSLHRMTVSHDCVAAIQSHDSIAGSVVSSHQARSGDQAAETSCSLDFAPAWTCIVQQGGGRVDCRSLWSSRATRPAVGTRPLRPAAA